MTQATTWEMPGVGPKTQTMLDVIANSMFNALLTQHSGTSRPSYLTGKQGLWVDTTSAGSSPAYYILKYFDGADDVEVFRINATSNRVEGPLSYTALPEPETVASASTANIGATKTAQVLVAGTTTITSFGTVANQMRMIRFGGALTLTHNATSLILPTAANIVTAAGDTALAVSDSSGNWRVLSYQRVNGQALVGGVTTYLTSFATTSGTAYDVTGIPATAKEIRISWRGVSTSGSLQLALRLGSSGGIVSTGYAGGYNNPPGGTAGPNSSVWVVYDGTSSGASLSGESVLTLVDSTNHIWSVDSTISRDGTSGQTRTSGYIQLSAVATQLRISAGGDSFDAGTASVMTRD